MTIPEVHFENLKELGASIISQASFASAARRNEGFGKGGRGSILSTLYAWESNGQCIKNILKRTADLCDNLAEQNSRDSFVVCADQGNAQSHRILLCIVQT